MFAGTQCEKLGTIEQDYSRDCIWEAAICFEVLLSASGGLLNTGAAPSNRAVFLNLGGAKEFKERRVKK